MVSAGPELPGRVPGRRGDGTVRTPTRDEVTERTHAETVHVDAPRRLVLGLDEGDHGIGPAPGGLDRQLEQPLATPRPRKAASTTTGPYISQRDALSG